MLLVTSIAALFVHSAEVTAGLIPTSVPQGWTVENRADFCSLSGQVGTREGPLTVALQPWLTRAGLKLTLSAAFLGRAPEGEDVTVTLLPSERAIAFKPMPSSIAASSTLVVVSDDISFRDLFAGSEGMRVSWKGMRSRMARSGLRQPS